MTAAEVQTGKYNWLAPWVGVAIILIGWAFAAGGQAQALNELHAEVQELKALVPDMAALKAGNLARDRELDDIRQGVRLINEKLDRLIERRPPGLK